jgi:hypothetical protein
MRINIQSQILRQGSPSQATRIEEKHRMNTRLPTLTMPLLAPNIALSQQPRTSPQNETASGPKAQ